LEKYRGAGPAGAILSKKKMENDARSRPNYGERVPYVVVYKGPKHRLIDAVVSPEELVNDHSLRIHGTYYITKQIIPPLARIFNLVGADIHQWFKEMPREFRAIDYPSQETNEKPAVKTIDFYYKPIHCLVCKNLPKLGKKFLDICDDYQNDISGSLLNLNHRIRNAEHRFKTVQLICRSCSGFASLHDVDINCCSLDCPVYYSKTTAETKLKQSTKLSKLANVLEDGEYKRRIQEMF
jgi:DNA polymerase zeta